MQTTSAVLIHPPPLWVPSTSKQQYRVQAHGFAMEAPEDQAMPCLCTARYYSRSHRRRVRADSTVDLVVIADPSPPQRCSSPSLEGWAGGSGDASGETRPVGNSVRRRLAR